MVDNSKLFEKYVLNNGVEVQNRTAVAPLTIFTSDEDGSVNDYERRYFKLRSENVGLYVLGACAINQEAITFPRQPLIISEKDLLANEERAKIVKANGALAINQIHHGGKEAVKNLSHTNRVVPSADIANQIKKDDGTFSEDDVAVELSNEDIERTIQDFAHATELSIKAGYDGVEIHGANNYLIQQFYSAYTNRRTDQWGGSLENRMRFPLRVVDACVQVREKLNRPDFVIGYRLSPEEPFENGLTMTETLALVKELVKRPLQYIHISLQDYFREARRGEGAGTIRLKLIHEITQGKVALVGVGGLKTAEDFNKAINSGLSEFVAAGRAYIVNKSFSTLLKENRTDEIKVEIDSDHPEDYELAPMLWNIALTSHGWIPVKEKN